jgi:membrane-associated phospholipid phosphatase
VRVLVVAALCLHVGAAAADSDPPPEPAPTDPNKPSSVTADPLPLPAKPPAPTQSQRPPPKEVRGPWYSGPYARNRFINLGVTAALDVFLLTDKTLGLTFPPSSCRICEPLGIDRGARHWFLWKDTNLASSLSDYSTFYISPLVGVALLVASEGDFSASRLIDDILPVAETVSIVQVATRLAKYGFARKRPYAYYGGAALDPTTEDNQSFWSGHSAIGFAVTGAAGTICHFRHYWTEPYVWGAGITLSLTTEYLRMAADKHWLSDVITGGLVGLGAGLLVPRLMQRSVKIVPVQNGLAVAGAF